MTLQSERQAVIGHALRSPENLRLALVVGSAYNDLKAEIVKSFASCLGKKLEADLGASWHVRLDDLRKVECGIAICKESWAGKFEIRLAADKSDAQDIYFGVKNLIEHTQGSDRELYRTLNDGVRSGKWSPSWEWYAYAESQYRNWNTTEVLLLLYRRDPVLVDTLVAELLQIAKVAEPVIDKLTAVSVAPELGR